MNLNKMEITLVIPQTDEVIDLTPVHQQLKFFFADRAQIEKYLEEKNEIIAANYVEAEGENLRVI